MSSTTMATNVRLTETEQETLRKKAIEINRMLVKQGRQPLRDSQIIHKILEKTIGCVQVDAAGEIQIELE